MARKSNTRAAQGSGSIRQRSDGRWEARFTYADELGQPQRGSVYGKTQKECRQKLTAALKAVDDGSYFRAPKRYTLEAWLMEWLDTYCIDLKPSSIANYRSKVKNNILPYLGRCQLSALSNAQVQRWVNLLLKGSDENKPLAPKSVKCAHGILHKALEQATYNRLICDNPADHIKLPKVKRQKLQLIIDEDLGRFLKAIHGDPFERLFIVDLFSGLRQSELLGLRWQDVDLENGTLTICRQIQKSAEKGVGYITLDETKNGKSRVASVAPSIVKTLKAQKRQQAIWRLAAGVMWDNPDNLVFTNALGHNLNHQTVYRHFKKIVASIGIPDARFHDLRHSYAVNALQAGDNVKEVQEQLGHYSSAFTMDVYAAVSETMRKESQARMEALIQSASEA